MTPRGKHVSGATHKITKRSVTLCRSSLSIASWNVHGLWSIHQDPLFLDSINNFDILALSETWLSPSQCEVVKNNLEQSGYDVTNKPWPRKPKAIHHPGGITILIKKDILKGVSIIDNVNQNFIWLKCSKTFFKTERDIFLAAVYFPPQSGSKPNNPYEELEESIHKYYPSGEIALLGDFNARTGESPDMVPDQYLNEDEGNHLHMPLFREAYNDVSERNSRDKKMSPYGRKLLELCQSMQLTILNGRTVGDHFGEFTSYQYNGCSVVDYVLSNPDFMGNVSYFYVHPLNGLSDHAMLSVEYKLPVLLRSPQDTTSQPLPKGFRWDGTSGALFAKALGIPTITEKLNDIITKNYENTQEGVDQCCNDISNLIIDTAKISLKLKGKARSSKRKWHNQDCKRMKKELLSLGKQLKASPYDTNLRHKFLALKRDYRRLIRNQNKAFRGKLLHELAEAEQRDPKKYWSLVNRLRQQKSSGNPIDPEIWFNYFKELSSASRVPTLSQCQAEIQAELKSLMNAEKKCETFDKPFHESEISLALSNLPNGKAFAEDCITNEMLKHGRHALAKPITKIFNFIFDQERFPELWSRGLICPFFKKGNTLDPDNYRGITVSSCLGKAFTHLLNNRLLEFLRENKILHPSQIGFMKGSRTADHIFVLKTIINSAKAKAQKVFACFVDFRKAFDTVWRDGLLFSLLQVGISTKFVRFISNMYKGLQSAVKIGTDCRTPFFSTTIGTRQGCNLSPMLFNILLNDLPKQLECSNCDPVQLGDRFICCLLYADDVLLMSRSPSGLQRSLSVLYEYSKKWGLVVNLKKTKIMVFNCRKPKWHFSLGADCVENCTSYSYLGVTFVPSGSFAKAQDTLTLKARRAYFLLRQTFKSDWNTPVPTLVKLFQSLIKPIMTYNAEIWYITDLGYQSIHQSFLEEVVQKSDNSKMEKLQIQFCKHTLGIGPKSSNVAARAEMGREPIILHVLVQAVKFYMRLLAKPKNSLLGCALLSQLQLMKANRPCFLTPVCLSLNESKLLGKITPGLSTLEQKKILNELKICLSSKFHTMFDRAVSQSKKLEFYRQIKGPYTLKNYLVTISKFHLRSSLSKLRVSAHRLPIEIGRYQNVPRQLRTCNLCKNAMGDEVHSILECKNPLVDGPCKEFIQEIVAICPALKSLPSRCQLQYLAAANDLDLTPIFCQYIAKVLKLHAQAIPDKSGSTSSVA